MHIRWEQMQAFKAAAEHSYETRLVRFLQDQFSDAAQESSDSLLEGVKAQIAAARRYGFVTEEETAVYVTSAWLLGGEFDHDFPAAQEMLSSDAPPAVKADWLAEFTRELFGRLEPST